MTVVFDTLAYARQLRDAGFSDEQAEAQARALASAMTDTLATKQDLRELEARFDNRLSELEKRIEIRFREQHAQMHGDLADLERRMTLRLGGIMVAVTGIAAALIELH